MGNGKTIDGYQFWLKLGQKFGWDKVPGTRFSLLDNGNGQVVFSSTGAGHGVGLCQWGAVGMAKEGKTYQQILEFYYPGCKVE
jgi:stage II sporulation protein D